MNKARVILLWVMALSLGGCGGGSSESTVLEPSPLVSIEVPARLERRWSADIGGSWGDASRGIRPLLQGGRVYLANPKGRMLALDAATGETLLRIKGERHIASGPGVGAGLLLAGTREGEVLAYAEGSGELLWQATLSGEVLSSPRVAADKVLVRTLDGKLFALSTASGRTLWVYADSVPALSLYGTSAPLIYKERAVLAGFDSGQLVHIDLDSGLPTWTIEIASPSGSTELERMVDIDADIKLAGNFLLSSSYQGRLVMADILTGQIAWGHNVSTFNSVGFDAGAGASGQVYVADEKGRLTALDATTGETVWEHELLLHRQLSAPVAYREYVACADAAGYLHLFHQADGRPAGRIKIAKHSRADAMAYEDLLILHTRGKVTAYQAE